MEQSIPFSPSSSYRSGINQRFAMSLPTELEELKGSVIYKYFAPSGADGHPPADLSRSLRIKFLFRHFSREESLIHLFLA